MKKKGFLIASLIFIIVLAIIYSIIAPRLTGNQIISVEEIENNNVQIENFRYDPYDITINVGEKVKWTNLDSIKHTVTSTVGEELNSRLLSQGETYSHTFDKPGEYEYYCVPHPYMKGKVIVE